MNSNANLLVSQVWPVNGLGRAAVLAVLGSALVAIAAQISVPMFPVPMTMQTLAVLAIGAAYGARLGAATLALYALEGAIGLPVFAEFKSGAAVIAGPTGGYIIGFILAAGLVGWLEERNTDRSILKTFAAVVLGAAILYVPGLIWLHGFANGWAQTFEWGITPFFVGDLLKAALAALGVRGAWSAMGKR